MAKKKNNGRSQKEMLLNYLMTGNAITDKEADSMFGIGRLSARIYELRHGMGYDIVTDMVKVMKRNGDYTYIGAYRLLKDKNE